MLVKYASNNYVTLLQEHRVNHALALLAPPKVWLVSCLNFCLVFSGATARWTKPPTAQKAEIFAVGGLAQRTSYRVRNKRDRYRFFRNLTYRQGETGETKLNVITMPESQSEGRRIRVVWASLAQKAEIFTGRPRQSYLPLFSL